MSRVKPRQPAPSTSTVARALAADRLGVPSVVFFVLTAATPFTVVAGVVTTGYATTGLIGIPVAFVVVGAVLALFATGYVAMAPHVANAGAFYAYISHGLSRPLGVGAAWVALAAYNALQVGLYGAIGAAATPLLQGWFGAAPPWWVIALAAWAVVGVLGVLQVDINGKVLAVLLVAEVAVIVLFSLTDLVHPAAGVVTGATLDPANLAGPGVGAILALAVLGFVGFESSAVFSEEARDPRRTVRTATYLSVAVIAALYALGAWAMSVATGPDQIVTAAQAQGINLMFSLAQAHLGSGLVTIGRVLFTTGLLAAMISFHNTTARYIFALGRERVLPAFLGRTSRRTGAPKAGSLVQTVIGVAVILTYASAGWDPLVRLFYWGGTAGGLGVLLLIAVTSIAVIAFFARHPCGEPIWRSRIAPILAAIAIIVVTVLAVANTATLLGVDEHSPLRWGVPAAYLAIALLGITWGLILRATKPGTYAAIGLGAKSATTVPRLGDTLARPHHTPGGHTGEETERP